MSAEAAAVARRAAEIIQERGACKGRMNDTEGRVCLHGALRDAAFELTRNYFAHDQSIKSALAAMFPDEITYFPGSWFNDNPATTELDVAKVLLQLADRLEVAS